MRKPKGGDTTTATRKKKRGEEGGDGEKDATRGEGREGAKGSRGRGFYLGVMPT